MTSDVTLERRTKKNIEQVTHVKHSSTQAHYTHKLLKFPITARMWHIHVIKRMLPFVMDNKLERSIRSKETIFSTFTCDSCDVCHWIWIMNEYNNTQK